MKLIKIKLFSFLIVVLLFFSVSLINAQTVNPAPAITSIEPTSITAGSLGLTLTVNGSNFIPSLPDIPNSGSLVYFNNQVVSTTYISSTQLRAQIPASALTTAGTYQIKVANPPPGGGVSKPTESQPPSIEQTTENTEQLSETTILSETQLKPPPEPIFLLPTSALTPKEGEELGELNIYLIDFDKGDVVNFKSNFLQGFSLETDRKGEGTGKFYLPEGNIYRISVEFPDDTAEIELDTDNSSSSLDLSQMDSGIIGFHFSPPKNITIAKAPTGGSGRLGRRPIGPRPTGCTGANGEKGICITTLGGCSTGFHFVGVCGGKNQLCCAPNEIASKTDCTNKPRGINGVCRSNSCGPGERIRYSKECQVATPPQGVCCLPKPTPPPLPPPPQTGDCKDAGGSCYSQCPADYGPISGTTQCKGSNASICCKKKELPPQTGDCKDAGGICLAVCSGNYISIPGNYTQCKGSLLPACCAVKPLTSGDCTNAGGYCRFKCNISEIESNFQCGPNSGIPATKCCVSSPNNPKMDCTNQGGLCTSEAACGQFKGQVVSSKECDPKLGDICCIKMGPSGCFRGWSDFKNKIDNKRDCDKRGECEWISQGITKFDGYCKNAEPPPPPPYKTCRELGGQCFKSCPKESDYGDPEYIPVPGGPYKDCDSLNPICCIVKPLDKGDCTDQGGQCRFFKCNVNEREVNSEQCGQWGGWGDTLKCCLPPLPPPPPPSPPPPQPIPGFK